MKDFPKVSPLRILEKSAHRALGKGNLGVLVARAGVGKTACLVHIAFDKLFRKERLIHISLEDIPEKVTSYYNVIYYDLVKGLGLKGEDESKMLIDRNRMILAYLNQSFSTARLRRNMNNLAEKIDFTPDALIVDGLDFSKTSAETFQDLKKLAGEFQVEIWFSALSPLGIPETDEGGIPQPCVHVADQCSIMVQLLPTPSALFLKLLKDHENPVLPDTHVRLDPNTFLVMD